MLIDHFKPKWNTLSFGSIKKETTWARLYAPNNNEKDNNKDVNTEDNGNDNNKI